MHVHQIIGYGSGYFPICGRPLSAPIYLKLKYPFYTWCVQIDVWGEPSLHILHLIVTLVLESNRARTCDLRYRLSMSESHRYRRLTCMGKTNFTPTNLPNGTIRCSMQKILKGGGKKLDHMIMSLKGSRSCSARYVDIWGRNIIFRLEFSNSLCTRMNT